MTRHTGAPFFNSIEQPGTAEEAFFQKLFDAGVGFDGLQILVELFNLPRELPALLAFNNAPDFVQLALIPGFPCGIAGGRLVFRRLDSAVSSLPVVHVEPLHMTDAHRRLHLGFAFHKDGLDVAVLDADRDGDFIAAHARVAGGVLGKERQKPVAMQDAFGDGPPPMVAGTDIVLVEPDIMATLLEVGLDTADQRLIGVAPVTQEDAERGNRRFGQDMVAIFADKRAAFFAEDDIRRGALGAMDFSGHDWLLHEVRCG